MVRGRNQDEHDTVINVGNFRWTPDTTHGVVVFGTDHAMNRRPLRMEVPSLYLEPCIYVPQTGLALQRKQGRRQAQAGHVDACTQTPMGHETNDMTGKEIASGTPGSGNISSHMAAGALHKTSIRGDPSACCSRELVCACLTGGLCRALPP
jgi:hypothetical protein